MIAIMVMAVIMVIMIVVFVFVFVFVFGHCTTPPGKLQASGAAVLRRERRQR
jgi:uncharacterized membrane protein